MNAPFRLESSNPLDWSAMRATADAWCGQCVGQFTKAETHVGEVLLSLSRDERSGPVRLDHLAGQRSAELERLLAERMDTPAQRAVKALQDFRRHERLRTFLCHGSITTLAEETGDYHLVLRVLEFRKEEAIRDTFYLSAGEMGLALTTLRRDCQRLGSHLGNLTSA